MVDLAMNTNSNFLIIHKQKKVKPDSQQMTSRYKVNMKSILLFCLNLTLINAANIEKKMEEYGIIPDVIDTAPSKTIEITYNNLAVNLGTELTPLQVKDEPTVKYEADENKYYTLLMVDPDAPSRANPSYGEVRHWFVGNIKGSDVKNGEHISAYVGSGPPKDTGLHRYIFLLYEQKQGKINFDEPKTASNSRAHRLNFKTRNFVEKYNLDTPIAGNFYQAQWDEYVEVRNKNITN